MHKVRFGVVACALAFGITAFPVLSGCGSSNGGSFVDNDGFVIGGGSNVTRVNEPWFSRDAVILALRNSRRAWLSADDARIFDADLRNIRSKVPALADIHARLEYEPRTLIVSVNNAAPWLSAWKAGTVLTGDRAVDAVLGQYDAVAVKTLLEAEGNTFFTLTFAQTLNMVNFKDIIKATSPHFVTVETNGIVGGGNNIVFTATGDSKTYTFSRGTGDCTAGCINNHYWDVTLARNGSVRVQERDTP